MLQFRINFSNTSCEILGHRNAQEEDLMVLGVFLEQVDSVEGPMPQTRFVLKKALQLGHSVVVVVNKVDRPSARPEYVVNTTFELFIELNATDEQVCATMTLL